MKVCSGIGISVLVVVALGHRGVETCKEGEFALQDSTCCPLCAKGWYVNKNCTMDTGVGCSECKKCENGLIIVNCTWFYDTKCKQEHFSLQPENSENIPMTTGKKITVYGIASTAVVFLIVAGVWRRCMTHKYDEDLAGKSFKILKIDI